MSLHLFETNDTHGVTCKKCLDKRSPVVSIRGTSSTLDESWAGLYLLATSAIEYSLADPTISAEPTNARGVLDDPTTASVVSANPTIGDAPADPTIGDTPADPTIGDAPSDPTVGDAPTVPTIGDAPADPTIGDATVGSEDDQNPATIIGEAPADLAMEDGHANFATRDASTNSSIITDAVFADPATGDVPANLAIFGDVVDPSIPATIRDALADPANTKNAPDPVIIGDVHVAPTIIRDAIIGDVPTTIIRYAFALPDLTITEDALVDPTNSRDVLANPTVIEDALAAPDIIGDAIIRDAPADPVIIKDTLASPTATGNVLADPSMDDASADPNHPIVRDAIRDASMDPSIIKDTFASFAIIGDSPAHPSISNASGNAIVDASSRNPSIIGDASADPSKISAVSAEGPEAPEPGTD
ncbi:sialidase-like isoform X2 [Chenopodium quinoa]|uniref:sialidase-like isoform X2 n=1 Tax=Chenopodium quinoa TaxID=63459 RepID=UPI000B799DE0|nr:sialidase-like isoform X2 [Chenopodium quinoa]